MAPRINQMKLLLPLDYVADVTKAIDKATKRIMILSMVIADGAVTHELIDSILLAARRGVEVSVAADVFTYGEIGGSFLPIRYYSKSSRQVTQMSKLLRDAGVKFHWLGRNHMTVFSGRTHGKWCIVDDTVYTFGGVNMYKEGTENADFMFRTKSTSLADRLAWEHERLIRSDRNGRLYRSRQFDFGHDHVLIDGGILGNSIIYRRACDLASSAKSIIFVSQYPPTGKLSKIFKSKKNRLYFNPPANAVGASGLNALVIRYGMNRARVTTLYRRKRYLHAKFMIFTMHDGSRVALTGSHNFNYGGVILGAREIALETRNPKVIDQLEQFLKTEII